MKNIRSFLFVLICACFSAVVIVMSFYMTFEAAGLKAYIADINGKIEEIETENRLLSLKLEDGIGIHKLDSYARERLGMRMPTAEQIYFIELVE